MDLTTALIVFVGSLASNSIPFIGVPYLIGVGIATSRMGPLDTALTIVLSSLGASIGKIAVYFFGKVFRLKMSDETKKNLEVFRDLMGRSLFIATLVFAATPLPDDVLYIPLGMSGYPLAPYFLGVFIGKLVLTSVLCIYFGYTARFVEGLISRNLVAGIGVACMLSVVTSILAYAIVKMDWVKIASTWKSEGALSGMRILLKEFLRVTSGLLRRATLRR